MGELFILYESASGYALFSRVKSEEIGVTLADVQDSIVDLQRFNKIIKLVAFQPFTSLENSLENINAISEGELTPHLHDWLEVSLPKSKKSGQEKLKFKLGVAEPKLGNSIAESLKIKVISNELVLELIRGIRLHFTKFMQNLSDADLSQAQLGLSHSYSRAKVKFNIHRVDNMIIQSIAILDQLDKDLNTFVMRIREWYSWHFPELIRIVKDNYQFARLAKFIKNKSTLSEESIPGMVEITNDEEVAKQILQAAKMSMGTDISPIDMINIEEFATRVISLSEYKKKLYDYLVKKMNDCAPNLTALIGEQVGARLISHAGSLTNLAKAPASTVQILGAEKALFRALKTRGKTPKYGLIFHSSFIGRAGAKNKGRISRYLANKCALASRIDSFSEFPTNKFGDNFKSQVEERLEFYKSGKTPRKNQDVMIKAIGEVSSESKEEKKEITPDTPQTNGVEKTKKKKKKKSKKNNSDAPLPIASATTPAATTPAPTEEPAKKKKKKRKASEVSADPTPTATTTSATTITTTSVPDPSAEKPKKKKKKNKKPKV